MSNPVRLTRRVTFSAGHRYWNASLSAPENKALYGPIASPFNHGHNYVLDVTTEGFISPENGMVINIKRIDDRLKEHVLAPFHLKSINDEVPAFAERAPTIENLLLYFAELLGPIMPPEARLVGLRLEEHPLLWGEWNHDPAMITLTRMYEFAASHRLDAPSLSLSENIDLFGKCNNINGHGHNYLLEVTVTGDIAPETGMMVDLDTLDQVVSRSIVDRYDHKNLNLDLPEFEGKNTTSEVVAQTIFESLRGQVPGKLVRVRLHETARNIFEVQA